MRVCVRSISYYFVTFIIIVVIRGVYCIGAHSARVHPNWYIMFFGFINEKTQPAAYDVPGIVSEHEHNRIFFIAQIYRSAFNF